MKKQSKERYILASMHEFSVIIPLSAQPFSRMKNGNRASSLVAVVYFEL
ncbi:hypothetical protein HUB94_22965 (plasmid) [Paenibacillus cellulosilyticus]|nr:hypothetical protein HUB94_22965 [Paenibacillus cellulosilyticus]